MQVTFAHQYPKIPKNIIIFWYCIVSSILLIHIGWPFVVRKYKLKDILSTELKGKFTKIWQKLAFIFRGLQKIAVTFEEDPTV